MSGDPAAAGDAGGVDPAMVHTPPELAEALRRLRGSRSYAELDKAVNPNYGRPGPRMLPPSTLNNLLHGRSAPTRETVVRFLTACGLEEADQEPWLAAWERVNTRHLRRPPAAVRVREARARLLGVHAAICVEGAEGELPAYVPRDLDAELRTAITAAAKRGGLVLLVGGSSVGKTRSLFEAIRSVLPEWWLIHPDPTALSVVAARPTPRTVVWLDELQRYLDTPAGVSAALVRSLVAGGVVMVATMWPNEYNSRAAARIPGELERAGNDRELVGIARVIDVPDTFSTAERRRAEALAADRRIRIALDTPDAGFTQVLAAGPELVRSWENAPDPYGKAVITAALDARRIGATAPLTRDFFATAGPGYLTSAHRATAPTDWLDRALRYATDPMHGATSPLTPVAAGMGEVAGYTVADYLHQHGRRVRRTLPLPDATWLALVNHHHPDDARRIGDGAVRRMRLDHAEALYCQAANGGDGYAAKWVAELFAKHGRIGELRARAETGDSYAAMRLAELLNRQGDIDEAIVVLRVRADAGDDGAADRLVDLLVEHGRVDELRVRAYAGDIFAADRLAGQLAKHGRIDELRAWAETDRIDALDRLASLLAKQGRVDELRARAEAGDGYAAMRLADLFAAHGTIEEAEAILRTHADAGDTFAADRLAELLAKRGRIDEAAALLRRRAEPGSDHAWWVTAERLAGLLAEHGRIDELRSRADSGDGYAAHRLVGLLVNQGCLDEAEAVLRGRTETGDGYAEDWLVSLLTEQGRVAEAEAVRRTWTNAGDRDSRHRLADLLIEQGRLDEARTVLQTGVDANDWRAKGRLVDLLAEQGRLTELGARADVGDGFAAVKLAGLLAGQGRIDELRTRANAGDKAAADRLTGLLMAQGRIEEAEAVLRARADVGDSVAAHRLADLLIERGRLDEAVTVLQTWTDAGDGEAARRLVELLSGAGRIEELEAEVQAGTPGAAEHLRRIG